MDHIKNSAIKPTLPVIAILIIITGILYASDTTESNRVEGFFFFPGARLSVTPAFFTGAPRYGSLSRYLSLDAFRYGSLVPSFSTYETFDYRTGDESFRLNRIYYNMEYINTRVETNYGNASLFIDHRCMNYVDLYRPVNRQLRWYGYGFRWESGGMVIGEKNRGHGLTLLSSGDYINFSVTGRKAISTRYYPYDYTAELKVRLDYYLAPGIVPYIYAGGELFLPDKEILRREAEFGARLGKGNTLLIPYAEYSHTADREMPYGNSRTSTSFGLKIESSLQEEENTLHPRTAGGSRLSLSPELHLNGSYSKFIGDDERNYRSDILIAFSLLTPGGSGLFCGSSLVHSSPRLKEGTGLYPRYIDYYNEAGLTYNTDWGIFIEPLYRYTGFGEGNTVDAGSYTYHLTGMRITSAGMKPGHLNSGIADLTAASFRFILNTEAEITAGWIPGNKTDKHCWIAEAGIREDLCGFNSAILYLAVNGTVKKGDVPGRKDMTGEIRPEFGMRFNRKLVMMLFYQYIKRNEEDNDYDISREYHLAGIRINI